MTSSRQPAILKIIDGEGREIALSGRAARIAIWLILNAHKVNEANQGQIAFDFSGDSLRIERKEREEG